MPHLAFQAQVPKLRTQILASFCPPVSAHFIQHIPRHSAICFLMWGVPGPKDGLSLNKDVGVISMNERFGVGGVSAVRQETHTDQYCLLAGNRFCSGYGDGVLCAL